MDSTSYIKLESDIASLLCCPFCKSDISLSENEALCSSCGSQYRSKLVNTGSQKEKVFDFKIDYPKEFMPDGHVKWSELQNEFEDYHDHYTELDNKNYYNDEIDSVREIYQTEFKLSGKILDVGGNQGRLRHYLDLENPENKYLSIDPYINAFENISKSNILLNSYPCLSQSCNFINGSAEFLPIKSQTFDWVHMRSVIDHFENPFFALKEAYRVLKTGGHLLIGLAIEEKGMDASLPQRIINKISNEGLPSIASAVQRRVKGLIKGHHDDHMFRFGDEDLISLVKKCGFEIEKIHWQKPPYSFCIYISGKKSK